MKTFKQYLQSEYACSAALDFVGDQTLQQAWDTAPDAQWMLWLMLCVGYQDDQLYRLFGCWCAANTPLGDGRVTWDLLTDTRSRKAILVAIDFANGEATSAELDEAHNAAAYATYAATHAAAAAAAAAATRATYAAAAAAAAAATAATHATHAAAYATYAAAAAATHATHAAARKTQSDELRRRVDFRKLTRLVEQACK